MLVDLMKTKNDDSLTNHFDLQCFYQKLNQILLTIDLLGV